MNETPHLNPAPPGEHAIPCLTRAYERLLRIGFALVPLMAIVYLEQFQDPALRFEDHAIHELAIACAIAVGSFVAYVTWRCFLCSGEPFLRWLTLGFLGFTLVYAPHGILTRAADHNLWLFLLYGPFSRLLMAACLFWSLLRYGAPPEPLAARRDPRFWGYWSVAFLALDGVIAILAHTPLAAHPALRIGLELGALALCLGGLLILLARRIGAPLMTFHAVALAAFAQSSLGFLLAAPWNHQWWLAHTVFAGGFFVLSFGVVRAYHTTHAFSTVYSVEEMLWQLASEKARAETALARLSEAHQALERLAATDPLTGALNRREFIARAEAEIARAQRSGSPLSVLALDLDHFKRINDTCGHPAGDAVLRQLVTTVRGIVRPSDPVGRFGGEEFLVLLPDTPGTAARAVAERIRDACRTIRADAAPDAPPVTVSIGVAGLEAGQDTSAQLFGRADECLYRAKREGRNRVIAP